MGGWMDGWHKAGWMIRRMDGWMDEWMDGWTDRKTDRWMAGGFKCMDGWWMDGWLNRWMAS